MAVNGQSDHNSVKVSGYITRDAEFREGESRDGGSYAFFNFPVKSERVNRDGEVAGGTTFKIQMSNDVARWWHQRGTLHQGVYVFLDGLQMQTRSYTDRNGNEQWETYFVFDPFRSTIIIDHNHEANAGLTTRPIDAQTGAPVERESTEERVVPQRAPARATVPTRVAPRASVPQRATVPARAPAPVRETQVAEEAPPAPVRAAPSRMTAVKRATPTPAEQKAAAAEAVKRPRPPAVPGDDDDDLPF